MVIVNCCGVQICTIILIHIYTTRVVYLCIKTAGTWPEEIESSHARRWTMVTFVQKRLRIARGIYGGALSAFYFSHKSFIV